jgi:glucokinase
LNELLAEENGRPLEAIGVSCGSPLDSQAGLILSPPNLPLWERVDVRTPLERGFNVPVGLQNDANACALAEWLWGAGKGCRNMIFLTFGTGMGSGLILDGKLYAGTNDNAGEVGHIRLDETGPVGYGKEGSFEGFCSGGGIAQLAHSMAVEWLAAGKSTTVCASSEELPGITAEKVGRAAQQGDELALAVFHSVGQRLGQGLAILVDVLNPERIILGSIYPRQQSILEPILKDILRKEALEGPLSVCQILPAGLGEAVGDLASLSVAMNVLDRRKR